MGLAELFAISVDAAVLQVLRDSGRLLVKSEILAELARAGVPGSDADSAWGAAQKRLRVDPRVITEKDRLSVRYGWNPEPPPAPNPAEALALLVRGRLTLGEREALAEAVRAGMNAAGSGRISEETVSTNRLRQVELDAARELAGMAIDVEEQVAKGASAKAIIHRVRTRMKRLRLEPIDKAGESVPFDQVRHQPIRAGIPDGAKVLVVRPGYAWRTPGDDILLERPLVQD